MEYVRIKKEWKINKWNVMKSFYNNITIIPLL